MRWFYQLQNVDVDEVRAIKADYKVIDPFDDEGQRWGAHMMRGDAGTKMLAYLSIGEAEDYRKYWNKAWNVPGAMPSWIKDENEDWLGNFKVEFWNPEWVAIIKREIDMLIAADFDGMYLDIIDAYEYFEDTATGQRNYRDDMRNFVKQLAGYARSKRPGFLVFPQNGEALLDDPTYVEMIDGIGKEDVWYGSVNDGHLNHPEDAGLTVKQLQPLLRAGKPVLAVEYHIAGYDVRFFKEQCEKHGYTPYVTVRELDAATPPPK